MGKRIRHRHKLFLKSAGKAAFVGSALIPGRNRGPDRLFSDRQRGVQAG
jgi:hypothetical protein